MHRIRRSADLFLLPLMILPLVLASCGPASGNRADRAAVLEDSGEAMEFRIDQDLLGPQYAFEDIGLLFSPPSGWGKADEQTVSLLRERLDRASEAAPISYGVIDLFMDDSAGTLCLLTVISSPDSASPFDLDGYKASILQSSEEVAEAEFTVGSFRISQFRIVQPQIVTFKLLFRPAADPSGTGASRERICQIDYILPRDAFEEEIRKVESSIGTLESL